MVFVTNGPVIFYKNASKEMVVKVTHMKICYQIVLVLALVAMACMIPVAADNSTETGDQGWYVIYCNVYGAKVYLDDKYVGTTQQGSLMVSVLTSTTYKTIRVQKNGYSTFVDSISKAPEKGGSVAIYTTLNEIPVTSPTVIGGDIGWYVVHCNIDGATVFFDESNRGEIAQGMVYVPVYSTGTPYKEYTVRKDGYTTYTATIPDVPGKGETIDLYATLNPKAATTTVAQIGGDVGWYIVHCNVEGATVSFDNEVKGLVAKGNLSVSVYTTGTPYKTYTVYKAGYVPYTGALTQVPTKGESIDLYATLNAQTGSTTSPTPTQTPKSPQSLWICGISFIIAGIIMKGMRKK